MPSRKVMELDLDWINSIEVKDADLKTTVATSKFTDKTAINEHSTASWLIKGITFVDLSLLFGNETPETIKQLCEKATSPLSIASKTPGATKAQCAAVCVYPLRIEDAVKSLTELGAEKSIKVASVAAGFPTGQYPLHTRLAEIYYAVASGAQEIDVVIDRSLVLRGIWLQLYNELVEMRKACGKTCLKVILSVTECGSWTNVYKASVVAMAAGADFIKSSTGKEATTMTIHEGLVMCQAIKDFYKRTGIKVGLKPAGGVRTVENIVSWMLMLKEVLGEEWLNPKLFRIGTSSSSAMIDNVATFLANQQ